jgi:hypothetical protein
MRVAQPQVRAPGQLAAALLVGTKLERVVGAEADYRPDVEAGVTPGSDCHRLVATRRAAVHAVDNRDRARCLPFTLPHELADGQRRQLRKLGEAA